MKRKIYEELLKWKAETAYKSALLIDGARRVGKSYIAEEFAKNEYDTYIMIDFYRAPDEIRELFRLSLNDLDTLFMMLSSYYGIKLIPHKSLIIFDEVQEYPSARAAIKYLVADGRYDYIETGSLMSINENVKNIIIPSEEKHINMYPMDFEEFLWAMGNELLVPIIKNCFEKKKQMGQAMHRKAMELFRQYLIVGGMPQAVDIYTRTRDFEKVDEVKRMILDLYRQDIAKHATGYEVKTRAVFDEIPSMLSRHEKKFSPSLVEEGKKMKYFEEPLMWLQESMIGNICYNSAEPNIGLRMNMERTTLKCHLGDTGLLVSLAFDENGLVSNEIYRKLLFDKLEVNEGMFFENIVAQMLRAAGKKLYFYSNYSKENKDDRMEVDFLVSGSRIQSRHNISPIEVKSGKRYTLTSLNKYLKKYKEYCGMPYVVHTLDFEIKDGITYLPAYMVPFI